MDTQTRAARLSFYQKHLYETVLPFWLTNGIDKEYGGYFTCFNNSGERLVSTDKYVWSQGRMLWLLSYLSAKENFEKYSMLAQDGYEFLRKNSFLPSGNVAFVLTREGKPKEPIPGAGYDISTYADCFVVLGFAKYAATRNNEEAFKLALKLHRSILIRYEQREFRTEPEPLPFGYSAHGIPMILLNTTMELLLAAEELGHPAVEKLKNQCHNLADILLKKFIDEQDGAIRELIHDSGKEGPNILGRYVNPGHSLEDMWFLMHYALKLGGEREKEVIDTACRVVEKAFELGWDHEYGGLYHFVDKDGGKPKGELGAYAGHSLVRKLREDWADKLWWVHSEAIYATLLGYCLTGRKTLKNLYEQVHEYTFRTFPHPDPDVGEWIQIRNRQGKPTDKIVALPVKDPFHISRNLILLIELLEGYRT